MHDRLSWHHHQAYLTDPKLLSQLTTFVLLPLLLLGLILALAVGRLWLLLAGLGLGLLLVALILVLIRIGFGAGYGVDYRLDERGALCRVQPAARDNGVARLLTRLLRRLVRRPTVSGLGLLARPRQELFLRWPAVRGARYLSRLNTILLRAGIAQTMQLRPAAQDYAAARAIVERHALALDSLQPDPDA